MQFVTPLGGTCERTAAKLLGRDQQVLQPVDRGPDPAPELVRDQVKQQGLVRVPVGPTEPPLTGAARRGTPLPSVASPQPAAAARLGCLRHAEVPVEQPPAQGLAQPPLL